MVEAVRHRLVLQIAFPALIADRTIQRMVDQQKFHHAVTCLLDRLRVGVYRHPVAHRHRAGRDGLRRLLHLDQAHPAVAGDRQTFVVAETRDFDAGFLAGLKNGDAVRDLDFCTVDGEFCHLFARSPVRPPSSNAAT